MRAALVIMFTILASPVAVLAQSGSDTSFRPYISVLVAFAVSWLMLAMWVARLGSKVNRLLAERRSDASE